MDLTTFHALRTAEGQRCLAEAVARDVSDATALTVSTALRPRYPADLVAAAITQALLRARATTKFGADAARMYFTAEGLEQATGAAVAMHHAARYPAASRIADLCCGIGGDLRALATAHDVLAVDRDPLTAAIAEANADALGIARHVTVRCADVTTLDLAGYNAAFLDPARRANGQRVFDVRHYQPPWSFIETLAARVGNVGVKVAPGIPHGLVPVNAEAEWVSVNGDVKEAALWFGGLRTGEIARRATLLPMGDTLADTRMDDAAHPPVGAPRRYLYEPDGAVIRAGLVGAVAAHVDGALLDPTIAYITSDGYVDTPFAHAWAITDVMPFNLKRLRAFLKARGIGGAIIKKRGSPLDPDALTRDLRLIGPARATLFLTHIAGVHSVIVAGEREARRGHEAAMGT